MAGPLQQHVAEFLDKFGLKDIPDYEPVKKNTDYGLCIPNCSICEGLGVYSNPLTDRLTLCPNYYIAHWPSDLGIEKEEAYFLKLTSLQETDLINYTKDYVQKMFDDKFGMLYVYGSVGTGKTVLCKAVLLWAMFKYKIVPGHYTNHANMMDRLRYSFGERSKGDQYTNILKYYCELPILVIDEVGRDKDSEFSLASFGKIMDHRYALAKAGKAITILASNFRPEKVLDDYVVDRLRDVTNFVTSIEATSLRRSNDYDLKLNVDWWKGKL